MARIRTIKPEFPQSESMGNVSRDARLTFLQLWTIADDEGRLRGNSRMLASLLFPYDDDAPALIDTWLNELEKQGCIQRYQVDYQNYLQICNWLIHQKIDKPSKSKLPAPNGDSIQFEKPREDSSEDQGSRIKDQGEEGKGKEEKAISSSDDDRLACPVQSIINLYHECMPDNPMVKTVNKSREGAIKQRWREAAKLTCKPFGYSSREDGLASWRRFFEICAQSDFLTGKVRPRPGMSPFIADIDFLFSPTGFAKTLENKYHREAA